MLITVNMPEHSRTMQNSINPSALATHDAISAVLEPPRVNPSTLSDSSQHKQNSDSGSSDKSGSAHGGEEESDDDISTEIAVEHDGGLSSIASAVQVEGINFVPMHMPQMKMWKNC